MAVATNQPIMCTEADQAWIVRIGRYRFGDDMLHNQRRFREAVRQLKMSGLVDQHGSIYSVNERGFQLYEKLRPT